jgi:hypothetical protein
LSSDHPFLGTAFRLTTVYLYCGRWIWKFISMCGPIGRAHMAGTW